MNTISEEDLLHLLSGRTTGLFSRVLDRNLRDAALDISQEQSAILTELWKESPLTQNELVERTQKDKPGVSRLINILERKNLVARTASPEDKRINLIVLTKMGQRIENRVKDVVAETMEQALKDVDESDIAAVKKVFAQVYQNLR